MQTQNRVWPQGNEIAKQYAGCSEHLYRQEYEVQRGLFKPSNSLTMGTQIHFYGKPIRRSQRKNNGGGVQGSNSFQLSVWLQSLHLHLGQITQCGLPTTSVCMTNHCNGAKLQPTRLNTYACEKTKTHAYGHKSMCSEYVSPLITNTERWTLYRKLLLHDSKKKKKKKRTHSNRKWSVLRPNIYFCVVGCSITCWHSPPVKELQKGKSLHD